MKNIMALCLCLLGAAGSRAFAAASAGGEPADFLLFDTHARAIALSGAYTALAADSNALFYNPAGLGFIQKDEVSLMHNQYLQGLTYDYLGYASRKGFGVNLRYLNFGNTPRTTLSNPGGTGGTAAMNNMALAAGYGRAFSDSLSLGAAGKYVRSDLDGTVSQGFAFDAGALYKAPWLTGLSLGLSSVNMGPDIKSQSKKEPLPQTFRAGAAYAFPVLGISNTISVDAAKTRFDRWRCGVGLESLLGGLLALRAGVSTLKDAGIGITGGVGIFWKELSFDYALSPFGELGNSHSVSLTYKWGSSPAKIADNGSRMIMVAE